MSRVGTPRPCLLNLLPFDVHGDCDANLPVSKYKVEAIVHTGGNLPKFTLQSREIQGVDLVIKNAADRAALDSVVSSMEDIPITFVTLEGEAYTTLGVVNETTPASFATGKATVTLISTSNEWSPV